MSNKDTMLHILGSSFAHGPKPTSRDLAMFGYSSETKSFIVKAIELSPALEDSILKIAELAYGDGQDSMT